MSAELLSKLKVPDGIASEPQAGPFTLSPVLLSHAKLCHDTTQGDFNAVTKYLLSIGVKRNDSAIGRFLKRQVKRGKWKDYASKFALHVLLRIKSSDFSFI